MVWLLGKWVSDTATDVLAMSVNTLLAWFNFKTSDGYWASNAELESQAHINAIDLQIGDTVP